MLSASFYFIFNFKKIKQTNESLNILFRSFQLSKLIMNNDGAHFWISLTRFEPKQTTNTRKVFISISDTEIISIQLIYKYSIVKRSKYFDECLTFVFAQDLKQVRSLQQWSDSILDKKNGMKTPLVAGNFWISKLK